MDASTSLEKQIRDLAIGVRVLVMLILGFISYNNILLTWKIPGFRMLFEDFLSGAPLPLVTNFVISYSGVLFLVAVLLPLGGLLVAWRVKSHKKALVALCALIVLGFVQVSVCGIALSAPIFQILNGMRGV